MKSGFVSLIGRANTGKSTLLNTLVNDHISITSNKSGTTRNIIQGIYNEENYQIVFVDTPGIHKAVNKLGKILNKQAHSLIKDIDLVLFLVDGETGYGKGDQLIIDTLKTTTSPVVLVINKIDRISDELLLERISFYKDLYPFADIVPVSATTKKNSDVLMEVIKKYLVDEVRYFETDIKTSNSINFMISEFVREKLFRETEKEIPHRLTCVTTAFQEKEKIVNITVDIIVDRDSLKKIIIGKKGERLKLVGTQARSDIENMLKKQVYLELYVKTIKDWGNKDRKLTELGFNELE